LYSISRS